MMRTTTIRSRQEIRDAYFKSSWSASLCINQSNQGVMCEAFSAPSFIFNSGRKCLNPFSFFFLMAFPLMSSSCLKCIAHKRRRRRGRMEEAFDDVCCFAENGGQMAHRRKKWRDDKGTRIVSPPPLPSVTCASRTRFPQQLHETPRP